MPGGSLPLPDLRAALDSPERTAIAALPHRASTIAGLGKTAKRVVATLGAAPGLTTQNIADLLGYTHPTATYHLEHLRAKRLVRSVKDGRIVRHYLRGDEPMPMLQMRVFMQDDIRRKVIEFLLSDDGEKPSINRIAKQLALSHGKTQRFLKLLEDAGLVTVNQDKPTHGVHCLPIMRDAFEQVKQTL